ncbi:Cysteine-rich receptor-kinase-like protein [Melia azedarach]|uniref:Cysteine-rich receptor-kinase-like protein n=1 Tax=Melia azedarach TaxID=155640 RepID=A0ACC1WVS2_MELAZ|nr:Cysteine-rich receptor-kinase-like protein [Melia azedarach]
MASLRVLLFFFCSMLLHLFALTISQQDEQLNHICSGNEGNFTTNSTYEANLNQLLSSLTSNNKIDYGFYNASYGRDSNQVNAMALCRGDVKPDSCRSCISTSVLELPKRCPNEKEAFIWYDNCMLRYSDRFFFGEMEFGPWFWMYNLNNVSNPNTFNQAVGTLLDSLKNKAASGDSHRKFATGNANTPNSQTIYALVQCTPDLSAQQCLDCLNNATALLPQCCNGRQGGRIIAPSCNFRYEIDHFYEDTADGPTISPSPPPASEPPASPDESPPSAASPPPTSQHPASPDESPPPATSPPPTSQPPVSPDDSSPLPTPTAQPPANSANQGGKASHLVLVLISLFLSQYL